ncbi:hypothetical protein LU690_08545 [Pseudomonas monteilii]|nr:hypothetical protein [Pseudomonas monteilii]WJO34801.1 hypothetical protein LU690_08545 [Pseudomonas monteilii]
MDWFRMYGEFATDPKVQMMNEAMQRRLVMLFCLECSNGLETFHVTERETSIAFALRVSDEEIAATKAVFLAKGFINDDWTLRNWSKRQYVSDSSTARVRAHREKKKRESAKPETDVKRSSNAPEQIQNRTDTEQNRYRRNTTTSARGRFRFPRSLRHDCRLAAQLEDLPGRVAPDGHHAAGLRPGPVPGISLVLVCIAR